MVFTLQALIQQDLGDNTLAQLLDLNDRLNTRIRAWHTFYSQMRPEQAAAAMKARSPPASWSRQGSGRSLGSAEGTDSNHSSQGGRWSPVPGSLGIVAPKVPPPFLSPSSESWSSHHPDSRGVIRHALFKFATLYSLSFQRAASARRPSKSHRHPTRADYLQALCEI